jgi:hypothetical protein
MESTETLLSACFLLLSWLAYSSILTMEAVQSSETSVNYTGLHGVTNLIASSGKSGAYKRLVGNTGLALLLSNCYLIFLQNYWGFRLFPSSGVFENRNTTFRKLDVSVLR